MKGENSSIRYINPHMLHRFSVCAYTIHIIIQPILDSDSIVLPASKSQDVDIAESVSKELSTSEIIQAAFTTENDEPQVLTNSSAKAVSWFLYLFGMVGVSFLGPLCNLLAIQYANPSILAPFSGLSLVFVIMFSGLITGEHPQRTQKVACALIVTGEVIVALFGDHSNARNMDVNEVIESYQDPAFIVLMVFMLSFIGVLLFIIRKFPTTSLFTKLAWGSLGGAIVGFQNFLKDTMTVFSASQGGPLPAIFYILFIMAIVIAITGIYCISASMKRYDATYASAMFVASVVIATSLMSAVHYNTFEEINGVGAVVMYLLGLAVLIYGAAILVKPTVVSCVSDKEHESDEESDALEAGAAKVYGTNKDTLLEVPHVS